MGSPFTIHFCDAHGHEKHLVSVESLEALPATLTFWAKKPHIAKAGFTHPTTHQWTVLYHQGRTFGPTPNPKGGLTMGKSTTTKGTTKPTLADVQPLSVSIPVAVKLATESITVPLTDKEQVALGQSMANTMVQIEHHKQQLAESIKAQRAHLDTLKAAVRTSAKTLANGYKHELAQVELHFDFNVERVTTMYQGKALKERPMTEEEKQLDLEVCLQLGMSLKPPVLTATEAAPKAQAG